MVKIRLARSGAKKRPFFHVVATDHRSPRDSKFLEKLGFYNPGATGGEQTLVFDAARIEHWTQTGAQVSPRVAYLIKHVGQGPEAEAKAKSKKPGKPKPSKKAQAAAAKKAEESKAAEAAPKPEAAESVAPEAEAAKAD